MKCLIFVLGLIIGLMINWMPAFGQDDIPDTAICGTSAAMDSLVMGKVIPIPSLSPETVIGSTHFLVHSNRDRVIVNLHMKLIDVNIHFDLK